jgi:indole-3-glycerol phosphate synthase
MSASDGMVRPLSVVGSSSYRSYGVRADHNERQKRQRRRCCGRRQPTHRFRAVAAALSAVLAAVGVMEASVGVAAVQAFVVPPPVATTRSSAIPQQPRLHQKRTPTTTQLLAVGVLAKKAKQAELRKYVQEVGVEDSVMHVYKKIQEALKGEDGADPNVTPGPLQLALTRRRGTITVIAEYKRKNDQCESGYIGDVYDPELLSPVFREYGCSGIAVLADERMGGCTYEDLKAFVEEQRRARNEVPGSVMVINSDLIVDELQVARTAACGAAACVITLSVAGPESLPTLLRACRAADIEAIVAVSTPDEAQRAVDAGARIVSVVAVDGVEDKVKVVQNLSVPDGHQVCKIASILARNDKQLQEIEEAWALRDKGFQCAWVSDALYKGGADAIEHPGAIIRSMKSKSSLKWASPKAYSGKGEGAREYLGDILM